MKKSRLSRRQFIKITAIAGGLLAGGEIVRRAIRPTLKTLQFSRELMGSTIQLSLVTYDEEVGNKALQMTFDELARLASIFNHRVASSPLARLNAQGELADPPQELVQVMKQAVLLSSQTGGAFDVTVKPLEDLYLKAQRESQGLPDQAALEQALSRVGYHKLRINEQGLWFEEAGMQVTLDGIAKGYVVDCGVALLRSMGFENVLVEASGDLLAWGEDTGQSPWQISIQSPRASHPGYLERFDLLDRAAATSGDYMHAFTEDFSANQILNPSTGYSPPELASATVVGKNATQCDGLATALMVLGLRSGMLVIESLAGFDACLVTKDLRVYKSSGFTNRVLV
jgi:thiamine biosynthesis lipoprotein